MEISPTIFDELIDFLGKDVQKRTVRELDSIRYYSLIAHPIPNVLHSDETMLPRIFVQVFWDLSLMTIMNKHFYTCHSLPITITYRPYKDHNIFKFLN